MNLATITASTLVRIPESEPERLFSGPDSVATEYKGLAKRFHPDVPVTGDKTGFQHLHALHDAALVKIKIGEWKTPGLLIVKGDDGVEKRIRYSKEFDAGAGRGYIGKTLVTYVLAPDLADLAENARKVIVGFEGAKYPNDKVKTDIEHRRPRLKTSFKTVDGKTVLVIQKPEDVIRLRDVMDHYGGKIDPRHVAWIMSELHNLACWLEASKITHNDLSPDSIFISPPKHSAMILGGWWFSAPESGRMQRIQVGRTVAHAPQSVLATKQASIKTDLGLIRLLGRELLGDESGGSFAKNADIHPVLANWLRIATTGNARTDYKQWFTTLTAAFGERKFTPMTLKPSDVYQEN